MPCHHPTICISMDLVVQYFSQIFGELFFQQHTIYMLGFSNREIQSFNIFLCDKYSVTRFSNREIVINIQYFLFCILDGFSNPEIQLFRTDLIQILPVAGSCGHGTPFSTHRFVHTTMIILDFTREWVPSTERDDSCVFL